MNFIFFQKDSISTTIGYKLDYEDEKIEEVNIFDFDDKNMI